MVTAKVRTLLFDAWWRESVVAEAGAATRFNALYRHYLNAGGGSGMGRSAFVARLNGLGVRESKRKGERWRLGVRLLGVEAEADAPSPVKRARPVRVKAAAPTRGDAPPHVPLTPAQHASRQLSDTPLVRVTPYVPGESEAATMLMLDVSAPDDLASGRVAEELFRARVRQRAPVEAGGEGFSNERDDHYAGDLALAASAYAFAAGQPEDYREFLVMNGKPVRTANFGWHVLEIVRRLWPWDAAWWKPRTAREDLVRAGALVMAAIEKLDRAEARGRLSAEEQRSATGV